MDPGRPETLEKMGKEGPWAPVRLVRLVSSQLPVGLGAIPQRASFCVLLV